MKAFLAQILVIDLDDLGKGEVEYCIKSADYVEPQVVTLDEYDLGEWEDSHPLNQGDTDILRYLGCDYKAENARLKEAIREALDKLNSPEPGSKDTGILILEALNLD